MSGIKKLLVVLLALASVTHESPALAKAAYAGKNQMIDCCEVIAVVDVKKVEKSDEKGSSWTFSEKATALPVRIIKGELSNPSLIYGGENFICARCEIPVGKSLVFLNRDDNRLIGSNWHLSIRPVKGGCLDWYDGQNMSPLKPAKLSEVVAQIEKELGDDPKLSKLTAPLKELSQSPSLCAREVGDTNKPSKIWLAYEKAVAEAKLEQKPLLWSMFKNSTPAGRIYASMILHHIDKEEGQKALALLSCCNGTVNYRSGCAVATVGIWQVASDLYSRAKYMNIAIK
ncbi:MAG: hypothetical protein K2X93_09020 [Candidatus Obscuribacterales bacterium]|nr:hypothetical protein [Candidatus Obscuribacterales bacterium]